MKYSKLLTVILSLLIISTFCNNDNESILKIVNKQTEVITYFRIADGEDVAGGFWGGDHLGNEVVNQDETYRFTITKGTYQILAQDKAMEAVSRISDFVFNAECEYTWRIKEAGTSYTYSEAVSQELITYPASNANCPEAESGGSSSGSG
jgi:hypothetical protein